MTPWISLNEPSQLDAIAYRSMTKPQVIFKHSTTCSISAIAQARLNDFEYNPDELDVYYLDLLAYRPISNAVADRFEVHHESPQIIIIDKGEVIYDESHLDINVSEIMEQVNMVNS